MKLTILALVAALGLSSCSTLEKTWNNLPKLSSKTEFEVETGCLLQRVKIEDERFANHTAYVGYCIDQAIVARWAVEQEDGGEVWFQVRREDGGEVVVQYKTADNVWVEWSSKAGLRFLVPSDFDEELKEVGLKISDYQ